LAGTGMRGGPAALRARRSGVKGRCSGVHNFDFLTGRRDDVIGTTARCAVPALTRSRGARPWPVWRACPVPSRTLLVLVLMHRAKATRACACLHARIPWHLGARGVADSVCHPWGSVGRVHHRGGLVVVPVAVRGVHRRRLSTWDWAAMVVVRVVRVLRRKGSRLRVRDGLRMTMVRVGWWLASARGLGDASPTV